MTDDSSENLTRERIDGELARIAAAPDFVRAPVMRRLLTYLIGETLDGRGDGLKAYSVAVDGLGRADDFDAQADSYPRVQVGRLRRMLDAFYAREGVKDDIRLHIPSGQYRVFFETGVAVPAEETSEVVPPGDTEAEPATPAAATMSPRMRIVAALVALVVVALIAGALSLSGRSQGDGATAALTQPPVLLLAPITAPPALMPAAATVDATLVDGLRRSWLVRVHDERDGKRAPPLTAAIRDREALPDYQLTGEIGGGPQPQLLLRLANRNTGQVLWSDAVNLAARSADMRAALSPAISELVQAYGVIATDERAVDGDRFAPGHRCVLEFDRYRRDRAATMHVQLTRCLDRTLELDPGHAMALAAKSFVEMDKLLYRFQPASPNAPAESLALARLAVAADPYNAFANLALARAAQYSVGCGVTVRSARQAIALNPYDADLIGVAGVLLLNCGQADGETFLQRSVALDSNAPTSIRSWLVYAALSRNDIAAARKLLDDLPPPSPSGEGPVALLRAIVAASAGDVDTARTSWARLWQVDPQVARDPNNLFERQNLPEPYREKSLAALARAGLVPPPPQPVATN